MDRLFRTMKMRLSLGVAALAGVIMPLLGPAQETPQGTGAGGPRTTTTTTAVDPGVITSQLGQGLHTTMLEPDGALGRVSTVLGVAEGAFVAGGRRTNRFPASTTQPLNQPTTLTNTVPQARGAGIRVQGTATPQGTQEEPAPPVIGR